MPGGYSTEEETLGLVNGLAAQVALTLSVASFGVVAPIADLNRTHATNPFWTGHARFHVVWQSITHIGLAVLACWVIWWVPLALQLRLNLGIALCTIVLAGFFATAASMRCYDGVLNDPNGYPPLRCSVGGRQFTVDYNMALFTCAACSLGVAVALMHWPPRTS